MEGVNEVQSTSRGSHDDFIDRIPTHFLVELTSLDELAFPANSTKRVKYTCVASTSKSLCLGTSTGSVYIFSRYAAKSRSRTNSGAPVPVQVFTTRDGQISTISVSPSEELMAIGGDSGRVSVAQLNNGQPPTLIYSTPGDARSPDRVTALSWSADLKTVYSGHSSGTLHCHRLTSRSVFRAAHQKLMKFDGEIIQIDTLQSHVLIATSLAAHLFHVESGTIQQVGKKTRSSPAPLGACYVHGESAFIVAARPNGRLWEANLVGVVYRTHQYRQSGQIPRAPPISFRSAFPTDSAQFCGLHPDNQDVSLQKIHVIHVDNGGGRSLVVSTAGSRICVVEMETSRVTCCAELDYDILDVSTCGNDIFVLLNDSKGLRKFSVFERQKTLEKLNLKGIFMQSAQLVLFCSPHITYPMPLLTTIIEGLGTLSRKKETEKLQLALQKMLDERKINQSTYDNNIEEMERKESLKKLKKTPESKKLPSGVHRVLQTAAQCSGYDDDFNFSTPQALRERSRSSPCGPESPIPLEKRASEPASLELRQEYWRKNGTPDVCEEDILHRARQILEDENSEKLVEKESLRTLLQLEGIKKDEIRFTPTVTIANAAKALAELALAVPVDLTAIWNSGNSQNSQNPQNPEKNGSKISKNPPQIVKVIRPGHRLQTTTTKPIATVTPITVPVANADDVAVNNMGMISEEMRRKQDEMWLDLRLTQHIKKHSSHANDDVIITSSPTSSNNVPKSDTDYTLTTGSEGPTPTSEHIWTNPLDDDVITPTSSSNCATCGMHRSWAATSLLMAVCGGANVLRDEFQRNGAIPQSHVAWSTLLRHVASVTSSQEAICPKCEMSLSTVERVCSDAWKTANGMAEDGVRPNVERIFERCISNSSREKLEAIVMRREFGKFEDCKDFDQKIDFPGEKPIKIDETDENIDFLNATCLQWTRAVPLRTFLALSVFTIGKKATISIITAENQYIARRMAPADWCSIVVIGAREIGFKDLLGVKTITSVFDSVGASGWVAPRGKPPPTAAAATSSRKVTSPNGSAPAPSISSWIVDTNGKCPMCTLPVKMVVGGADRGVISYFCGHVYHKICLTGRFNAGCVACRVRARRATRAGSSATSSPVASPIMSPRHQKI